MQRKAFLVTVLLLSGLSVRADVVAIIGTGNVGMALGTEMAGLGHTVIYGSRTPDGLKAQDLVAKTAGDAQALPPAAAAAAADIVVLAVPGMVVENVVRGLGDLAGKIVIDATNPLVRNKALQFEYGVETSNGEIVQAALPGAYVVKAFNTIAWQQMIDPPADGWPLTVPLAGDHGPSKTRIAEIVVAMGLEPFDIGPITASRWTEYGVVVKQNNAFSERDSFDIHLRKTD